MSVEKINRLFKEELKVINIGLTSFAEDLEKEGVKVLKTDWRPPAGGDRKLISLLERLDR
jgi:hypothetical protein